MAKKEKVVQQLYGCPTCEEKIEFEQPGMCPLCKAKLEKMCEWCLHPVSKCTC